MKTETWIDVSKALGTIRTILKADKSRNTTKVQKIIKEADARLGVLFEADRKKRRTILITPAPLFQR